MRLISTVVVYRDRFVVVEPEDEGLVCVRPFRPWSPFDLLGLVFLYGRRYFRTTDKYWWRRVSPVEDASWENIPRDRQEHFPEIDS